MPKKATLLLTLLASIAVSSSAQTISAINPNAAAQGTSELTVTFTLSGTMLPPAEATPDSVTIGTLSGTSVAHPSDDTVTAVFDIDFSEATGTNDASISFTDPMGNSDVYSMSRGFTVSAGANTAPTITKQPSSKTIYEGFYSYFSVTASGSDPMAYQWSKDELELVGETNAVYTIAAVSLADEGDYSCIVANDFGSETSTDATLAINTNEYPSTTGFTPVDTMQDECYNTNVMISAPVPGEAYAGQDAQYAGTAASYTLSGDGLTVYDNNTGLTWTQTADTDSDGDIDTNDKLTYDELFTHADSLNDEAYGGFADWRVPSIKEMYSLMDFHGIDPSGYEEDDISGLVPFIDRDYFDFAYGDTDAGERIIDAQYGTTDLYVDSDNAGDLLFGVNFADGRIKGYGLTLFGSDKTFSAMFCRGNEEYGVNDFESILDGVVVDKATGLMWQQADSLEGLNWEAALAYAEGLELGGYCDWRLPNAKELQGIVDYTRSPGTTASAAIDSIFNCTSITNETGQTDYAQYWTGTTHLNWTDGNAATYGVYIAFGRAMGYSSETGWTDVHGAGCQRSDPKSGELSDQEYADYGYYSALAPQGDNIRIYNYVRCVRGGATAPTTDSDGDGLSDWYEYNYTTNTTAMVASEDNDGDSVSNEDEEAAGTIPTDADTDDDGLNDGAEVHTYGTDPLKSDSDGDGITDGAEVNTYGTDPLDADSFPSVSNDFNGDGASDLMVLDQQTGRWFARSVGGDQLAYSVNWGWSGVEAVAGDYDGDGIGDLAVFDQNTGRWFIRTISGEILAWDVNWGWSGVEPVSGDFDGDGIDDLAVFDQNTGRWFIRSISGDILAWNVFWGWPGVQPISGDYDGDGVDDLAILDQNTGRWFVRTLAGDILAWQIIWGWDGVMGVSGDFDGDAQSDLAVFDVLTGRWFIRNISGDILAWDVNWGWSSVSPVSGDFDGDGVSDLSVFDDASGRWFIRSLAGEIIGWDINWGWAGVQPVGR